MGYVREDFLIVSDLDALLPNVFCDTGLKCFIYVAPQVEGPSNIISFTDKGTMSLIDPPSVGQHFEPEKKENMAYLGRLTRPEEVVFKAAVTSASAAERDCASAGLIALGGLSEGIDNEWAVSTLSLPG